MIDTKKPTELKKVLEL